MSWVPSVTSQAVSSRFSLVSRVSTSSVWASCQAMSTTSAPAAVASSASRPSMRPASRSIAPTYTCWPSPSSATTATRTPSRATFSALTSIFCSPGASTSRGGEPLDRSTTGRRSPPRSTVHTSPYRSQDGGVRFRPRIQRCHAPPSPSGAT